MGKISAIVSAYYAEQYLAGRLDNLLSQVDQIVLVCRHGSAEQDIAESSAMPDMHIITTPDIPTIYAAWNMAIAFCHGDYITNANCDDRAYPGKLRKLAAALDHNNKYAVAYGDVDRVREIGGAPFSRYTWAEGGIDQLIHGCFVGPMPLWRRGLHDKYGMFDADMHSAGDYEFWLRIARAGERLYHLRDDVVGAYLDRADSAEKRSPLRAAWETARARGRYRDGK
jgi:glycosyltransferase involved in cell wall biosynthesis